MVGFDPRDVSPTPQRVSIRLREHVHISRGPSNRQEQGGGKLEKTTKQQQPMRPPRRFGGGQPAIPELCQGGPAKFRFKNTTVGVLKF